MKLFDTHTHTNISPLKEEFEQLAQQYIDFRIGINIVGVDLISSKLAIEQSKYHNNFYCSIGIHPCDILKDEMLKNTIDELEQLYLSNKNKVKCIGEIGIDLHYRNDNLESQILWFKSQIKLAVKYNLIIMIHVRDAYEIVLEVLKQTQCYKTNNVIVHCFSSNWTIAKQFLDLGCFISIPGIVTFKSAIELKEVVKQINLDYLITETDAPYLTPAPFRSKINNSTYLNYTNEYIANLLNLDIDKLNSILLNNVKKLFKI